jgi:hypothetical protein
MSDKIAVYITSMGDTPEAVRAFVSSFSSRFGIPRDRVLALSERLPARLGSYEIDKAKRFGIEIRRLGGEVSLRRQAVPAGAPVAAPPAAEESGNSWVVHGHSESQDELRSMTQTAAGGPTAAESKDGLDAGMSDDFRPVFTPPPERKIGGKFEAKQVYTAEQAFGLNDEHFKKVKELYAGKKKKSKFIGSPVFKIGLLALVAAVAALLYLHRQEIRTSIFGLKEATLSDAYRGRVPANVSVPEDLTGDYSGETKYTTKDGDIAFVNVTLFIDGKNVHDVVAEISSSSADIGTYHLKVEYAPGYLSYTKTINDKVVYTIENTFPSSNNAVGRVDEQGRFDLELDGLAAGIDPQSVPATEKDHLGNVIFLKMEGAFAGSDRFYGGLLTSGSPLVGWEASKK